MRKKSTIRRKSRRSYARGLIDGILAHKMHQDYTENGVSYGDLSRKYNFSRSSIHDAFRRYNLPTNLLRNEESKQEIICKVCELYSSGKTYSEIRTVLGRRFHDKTLTTYLAKGGVAVRTRSEEEARRWKEHRELVPKIVEEYKQGTSALVLAKRYNVDPSFCYKWLRRSGVTIRNSNDRIYSSRSKNKSID